MNTRTYPELDRMPTRSAWQRGADGMPDWPSDVYAPTAAKHRGKQT